MLGFQHYSGPPGPSRDAALRNRPKGTGIVARRSPLLAASPPPGSHSQIPGEGRLDFLFRRSTPPSSSPTPHASGGVEAVSKPVSPKQRGTSKKKRRSVSQSGTKTQPFTFSTDARGKTRRGGRPTSVDEAQDGHDEPQTPSRGHKSARSKRNTMEFASAADTIFPGLAAGVGGGSSAYGGNSTMTDGKLSLSPPDSADSNARCPASGASSSSDHWEPSSPVPPTSQPLQSSALLRRKFRNSERPQSVIRVDPSDLLGVQVRGGSQLAQSQGGTFHESASSSSSGQVALVHRARRSSSSRFASHDGLPSNVETPPLDSPLTPSSFGGGPKTMRQLALSRRDIPDTSSAGEDQGVATTRDLRRGSLDTDEIHVGVVATSSSAGVLVGCGCESQEDEPKVSNSILRGRLFASRAVAGGEALDDRGRHVSFSTDRVVEVVQFNVDEHSQAPATTRVARRIFGGDLQGHVVQGGSVGSQGHRVSASINPMERLSNMNSSPAMPRDPEFSRSATTSRPGIRDLSSTTIGQPDSPS